MPDVENSLKLFTEIFGPLESKNFRITEIPYTHGQAFPNMVHLPYFIFDDDYIERFKGYFTFFTAHEIAHQWWGHSVKNETYHDVWLGEGLSHYSALMAHQLIYKDNDLFNSFLDRWKKDLTDNRESFLGNSQKQAPISFGYRASTKETKEDYGLLIYEKGAWVFHMLRQLMLNSKTMDESRFISMMKDYYTTFKGKRASTKGLQTIVEKHIGMDMQWFFDQWVYKTSIPKYEFAYKSLEKDNGKYSIRIKVKPFNVPDNFKVYMPIQINFDDDKFVKMKLLLNGKENIIQLPLLPLEPEEIIFNDMNSVLCEFETVNWNNIIGTN